MIRSHSSINGPTSACRLASLWSDREASSAPLPLGRGRLLSKPVTLGTPPPDSYEIVPAENADDAAKARYHALFVAEWTVKPAAAK